MRLFAQHGVDRAQHLVPQRHDRAVMSLAPVSYTHLDVYKRQARLLHPPSLFATRCFGATTGSTLSSSHWRESAGALHAADRLNRRQLGDAQRQPLGAVAWEVDLRTGIVPGALQRQHLAFAKFGMEHRHAHAQTAACAQHCCLMCLQPL